MSGENSNAQSTSSDAVYSVQGTDNPLKIKIQKKSRKNRLNQGSTGALTQYRIKSTEETVELLSEKIELLEQQVAAFEKRREDSYPPFSFCQAKEDLAKENLLKVKKSITLLINSLPVEDGKPFKRNFKTQQEILKVTHKIMYGMLLINRVVYSIFDP